MSPQPGDLTWVAPGTLCPLSSVTLDGGMGGPLGLGTRSGDPMSPSGVTRGVPLSWRQFLGVIGDPVSSEVTQGILGGCLCFGDKLWGQLGILYPPLG